MKPISMRILPRGTLLQNIPTGTGPIKIVGSVKALGVPYVKGTVYLFNARSALMIGMQETDADGNYGFYGLSKDMNLFLVAFDLTGTYNLSGQDRIKT